MSKHSRQTRVFKTRNRNDNKHWKNSFYYARKLLIESLDKNWFTLTEREKIAAIVYAEREGAGKFGTRKLVEFLRGANFDVYNEQTIGEGIAQDWGILDTLDDIMRGLSNYFDAEMFARDWIEENDAKVYDFMDAEYNADGINFRGYVNIV